MQIKDLLIFGTGSREKNAGMSRGVYRARDSFSYF